jgi:hypothetical protein
VGRCCEVGVIEFRVPVDGASKKAFAEWAKQYKSVSARFWNTDMRMNSPRLSFVAVTTALEFGRHHHQAAVIDAALADYMVSQMPDFAAVATKDVQFQTRFMIEMHVHGRNRKIVMVME